MNFTDLLARCAADGAASRALTVGSDWAQGRTLFGGAQTAIAVHRLSQLMPDDATLRTVQVTFIAPLAPDTPIRVEASKLREGRSAIHGEARLLDATGNTACVVLAVFGRPRASGLRFATAMPPATDEDALETPFVPELMPSFLQHFSTRWAPGCLPYSGAAKPVTRVWMAHRDPNPLTICHLIALADLIPTPALSTMKRPAMASSLTWSLDLLACNVAFAPTALWRVDAEVTDAADGYISQTATLFNPAGRAAAHARQTVTVFA